MTTPFPDDGPGPNVGGIPIQVLYETLVHSGISKGVAGQVIGGYLDKHPGVTKRTFAYTTSVPAGTGCTANFARTFTHTDWKDGRDVVQAEETTLEEGFNRRFHRIEDDLDALDVDVTQAFSCLNSLRGAVTTMLAEVKAELNRINVDLGALSECCEQRGVYEINPDIIDEIKYGGTTHFGGKPVHLYSTKQGMIMLPVASQPLVSSPRTMRPAALARFAQGNSVLTKFLSEGRGRTKDELLEQFGEVETDEGWPVSDLLSILPSSTRRFSSSEELVTEVAEREAGALRTEFAEGIGEAFGLNGSGAGTVGVEYLEEMPESGRTVLEEEGVRTIDDFLKLDSAQVTRMMRRHGVEASTSDVAGWRAAATVISHLR